MDSLEGAFPDDGEMGNVVGNVGHIVVVRSRETVVEDSGVANGGCVPLRFLDMVFVEKLVGEIHYATVEGVEGISRTEARNREARLELVVGLAMVEAGGVSGVEDRGGVSVRDEGDGHVDRMG